MTKAAAPAKSTASLNIAFGMVSVPVALYSGIGEIKVSRKWRTGPDASHEVGYITVDKSDGTLIERSEITNVYVMDDGVEVPLSDEEIDAAMGLAKGYAEIVGIYPSEQADRYVVTSRFQARPGKVANKVQAKPFALLMNALAERDSFALLKYALRGKAHLGILTADGALSEVAFDDEIRADRPMPEVPLTDMEKAQASMLVEAMTGDEAPLIDNDSVASVVAYVETKAAGGEFEAKAAPDTDASDLVAMLQASVDAVKAAKGQKVSA